MTKRRIVLWLALAAAAVLVGVLASGTVTGGGPGNQTAPTPPTTATIAEDTTQQAGVERPYGRDDWGTYGGTFDENRHSPLTQIGLTNVNQLGRVFSIDFRRIDPSIPKGQQSFPIVVGGVIYVTTSNDHVFAVDGRSGKVLWHFKPTGVGIFSNYGVNANRGAAYCDGRVFELTLDMRILALDARTGKLLQAVPISAAVPGATVDAGYSETQAPVCYHDLLFLGASGSDYGVRGFFMAYRAADLSPAWANPYWIIPPDLEGWRSGGRLIGGGANWNPPTIDTATNTVYITTSNPSPLFEPRVRPGRNPRTDSIVALDLATGHQKWWQQQLAGDQWGYSTVQPVLLYNVKIGNRVERVVSVATKEGVWFMYDAHTGAPIYGRVKLLNQIEHQPLRPGQPVRIYPAPLGGVNYSPSSFDPGTGYVINSAAETSAVLTQKQRPDTALYRLRGDLDLGLSNGSFGTVPSGWRDFGSVSAVDAGTGSVAWKFVTPEPGRGGITTTASGLGFAGGGDGALRAFDTATGHILWSFQAGYQIATAPAVYAVGGKEYLAITTGGTPTSSFGGTASHLDVFALGGDAQQSPAPPLLPPTSAPGLATAPTRWLSVQPSPRTAGMQVVASLDDRHGAATLDGTSNGAMTVRIPKGWHVNVTFVNHSQQSDDRLTLPALGADSGPVAPGGVRYFSFTASHEGTYSLRSTKRPAEAIAFVVTPSSSLPELVLGGITYATSLGGRSG